MSGNRGLDIFREIRVYGPSGSSGHQSDALRDLAAHRFRRANDRDGLGVSFDDDLGAGFHLAQNRYQVFGQVAFADVEPFHTVMIAFSATGGGRVLPRIRC